MAHAVLAQDRGRWLSLEEMRVVFPDRLYELLRLSGMNWNEMAAELDVAPAVLYCWRVQGPHQRIPAGTEMLRIAEFAKQLDALDVLLPGEGGAWPESESLRPTALHEAPLVTQAVPQPTRGPAMVEKPGAVTRSDFGSDFSRRLGPRSQLR